MAIEIANYPNATAPSGDYPSGDITDAAVGVSPTPVDSGTNGDLQQFFAKIMREGNIAYNNARDNTSNGWQFYEALLKVARSKWLNASRTDLNGETYTFLTNYFLFYNNPTAASNIIIIDGTGAYAGNEVYAIGFCHRGDTIAFTPAGSEAINVLTGLSSLTAYYTGIFYIRIKCIGANNFTAEIFTDDAAGALWTDWTDFGTLGSGWVNGTINSAYKRNADGQVQLGGIVYNPVSTSPASVLVVLAPGFRPLRTQIFFCPADFSGSYGGTWISVDTSGNVALVSPVPGSINYNICLDNIIFPTQ